MNKKQRTKANKEKKMKRDTIVRKDDGTKWGGYNTHLHSNSFIKKWGNDKKTIQIETEYHTDKDGNRHYFYKRNSHTNIEEGERQGYQGDKKE